MLFSGGRTARFVALLSVPTIIVIGIISAAQSWLGPIAPAVVIFAGLGLAAASPLRSATDAGRVAGAFALVLVGLFLTDLLRAYHFDFSLSPIMVGQGAGIVVAFIGALALLWPTARNLRPAPQPQPPSPSASVSGD